MPNGAWSKGARFSSAVCGAWSVARQSSVPSAMAAMTAARSAAERSGGFILASVSYSPTASSVSVQ